MSKEPPKKRFRQTSISDMFKPIAKASKAMDITPTESEVKDLNPIHDATCDAFSAGESSKDVNTADVSKQTEAKSPSKSQPGVSSSVAFGDDEDKNATYSNMKGKSPQKSPAKKNVSQKMKKRKHIIDQNSRTDFSVSRESEHECSNLNMIPRNKKESKASRSTENNGNSEDSVGTMSPSKVTWRGCPLSSMQVLNDISRHVPTIHPTSDHTVLVKLPLPDTGPPDPHPSSYSDIWDQHHVRMPCSPKSLYPISAGSDSLVPRWSVICKVLKREMKSVNDLQRTILEYNTRYAEKWNFKGLHYLIEQEFEEEERDHFFESTLPAIANLTLDLPNLVTLPPPMLTKHTTHSITLSQIQIASLLANAFFCTFPRRNAKGGDTEYASYPDINFNRLFLHKEKQSLQKMKCLLNYFRRVTKTRPEGLVTFTRQCINPNDLPSWETLSHHLPELHLDSNGLIEEKEGLLQVDFANKFIGGGVLGLGCVQEEIRFVLSPELIVSRLFTQVLDRTEALIVTGAEQFNDGIGYSSSFCWTGSHEDLTKCDVWKRRMCQIVAVDALRFMRPKAQYKPPLVLRELNKAYAGFRALKGSIGTPIGVATGNWGCGAFKGNPRLKALIQLAACGFAGRDVAYFTFGDEKLRNDLSTMHIFLKENNVTVGELVQVLMQYGEREWSDGSDLYHYIYSSLGSYDSDTDSGKDNCSDNPSKNEATKKGRPAMQTSNDFKSSETTHPHEKKENPRNSASSHSKNGNTCSNPAASSLPSQSGENRKGDGLTEEKIVQVLMECDNLVESQKKKSEESSSEILEEKKDN